MIPVRILAVSRGLTAGIISYIYLHITNLLQNLFRSSISVDSIFV